MLFQVTDEAVAVGGTVFVEVAKVVGIELVDVVARAVLNPQ